MFRQGESHIPEQLCTIAERVDHELGAHADVLCLIPGDATARGKRAAIPDAVYGFALWPVVDVIVNDQVDRVLFEPVQIVQERFERGRVRAVVGMDRRSSDRSTNRNS